MNRDRRSSARSPRHEGMPPTTSKLYICAFPFRLRCALVEVCGAAEHCTIFDPAFVHPLFS